MDANQHCEYFSQSGSINYVSSGIGGGAIDVLNNAGIEVVRGCSGDPNDTVNCFIAGLIIDSGLSCLQHEHHHSDGNDHVCNH